MSNIKCLVILGSSRGESNTLKAVDQLCPFHEFELLDLRNYQLNQYSYKHSDNSFDDFAFIAERMMRAENIVFATPVYWYAMSGLMKIFFDRLTELLSTYKSAGKSLKDKKTFLISVGSDQELPEGFEIPFKRTSEYFGMKYQKAFYMQSG